MIEDHKFRILKPAHHVHVELMSLPRADVGKVLPCFNR
jgi:hypothetical protein